MKAVSISIASKNFQVSTWTNTPTLASTKTSAKCKSKTVQMVSIADKLAFAPK